MRNWSNVSNKSVILGICFLWGGLCFLSSLYMILSRACAEVNGTIIEMKRVKDHPDRPVQRGNHEYTIYTIKPPTGGNNFEYKNTELADDLPIGSKIEKEKWKINYKVDGKIVEDFGRFPIILGYIGICLLMGGFLRIGYYLRYERDV